VYLPKTPLATAAEGSSFAQNPTKKGGEHVTHAENLSRLSRLIDSPAPDVLYSITMQQVTVPHAVWLWFVSE
jgi:hypothetical protein